jgi:uncharacterized membrane protein YdbT with pleckstrin-like domain
VKPILGLQEGERVVWSGRPTRMGYLSVYIRAIVGGILFWIVFGAAFYTLFFGWWFGIVLFLVFAGLGVLTIEIRIRANKYFVTDQRFMRDYTFISRHTESATMDLVADINYDQGLIQRAVNCGNVNILTAGTPTGFGRGRFPGFKFEAVYAPVEIAKIASTARTRYKSTLFSPQHGYPPPPPPGTA